MHRISQSWDIVASIFQSQLDFSLTSGPAEQGVSVSQAESKPAKVPHSNQISKSTPGTKVCWEQCTVAGWTQNTSFIKSSGSSLKLDFQMRRIQISYIIFL